MYLYLTIAEFIANKKEELNFEPLKNKVLKMQWEYNKLLLDNVKNNIKNMSGA